MTAVTTAEPRDDAADALAAFEELPRWLAVAMDPAAVGAELTRHVDELASGVLRLQACVPERLRAKGDSWLLRYRLEVLDLHDRVHEVVLTGTLWPPGRQVPREVAFGDHGGGAGHRVRFGVPGWRHYLAGLRADVAVEEHDEALPALPRLTEPGPAAELVQQVLRDAGSDAVVASCSPQVVRYKPGSRCTVVVPVQYAGPTPGPSPVVLKTHQGDKGHTAWAAMTALWDRQDGWRDVVHLAEPLGFLPEERILVQGPVPEERTLKELAREAIGDGSPAALDVLRGELAKTAAALAAIHDSGAEYGRTATLADELDEIEEVVDRLATTVPTLRSAADTFLAEQRRRAEALPADPVVPAHHDFRPAQVLLHEGRVGFIDFDGSCMAEPALDLGRFRAKLRDIGISALLQRDPGLLDRDHEPELAVLDELCDHFSAEYLRHRPVSEARVLLWESADLFTAMLHAWTKVRVARLRPRMLLLRRRLAAPDYQGM